MFNFFRKQLSSSETHTDSERGLGGGGGRRKRERKRKREKEGNRNRSTISRNVPNHSFLHTSINSLALPAVSVPFFNLL